MHPGPGKPPGFTETGLEHSHVTVVRHPSMMPVLSPHSTPVGLLPAKAVIFVVFSRVRCLIITRHSSG